MSESSLFSRIRGTHSQDQRTGDDSEAPDANAKVILLHVLAEGCRDSEHVFSVREPDRRVLEETRLRSIYLGRQE